MRGEGPVLIVEDDREVRQALGDLLARWNVPAELVGDGATAVAKLAAGSRYALLIADQRLPGDLDGLGPIARARTMVPELPAVLVTADFDAALVAEAAAQEVPLLHKPLRPEALRELLGLAAERGPELHGGWE
jgi:CheY-like chemotaxis protein